MNSLGHFSFEEVGVEPTGEEKRPVSTDQENASFKLDTGFQGKREAKLQRQTGHWWLPAGGEG